MVGKGAAAETREKFKERLLNNELDHIFIEITVQDNAPNSGASFEIPGMPGAAMGVLNISDFLGKALGTEKTKNKKMTVKDALETIAIEESDNLIDQDVLVREAIKAVENDGIVFIDEIDKITSRSGARGGEVSREGVQRDLLPLIEGTNVSTKFGQISTEHILFISSGAFHLSKPSDLLPELQGRLPIRVEMDSLTKEDLMRIMKEPECSLVKQYIALLKTEGAILEFSDDAISRIAEYATEFNREIEDIGARRLHTILEKLLEDISYETTNVESMHITIDEAFVEKQLEGLSQNKNLANFIL
jgi:ATP-dependent HslUV protease ATP-binding subunit HslU